MTNDKLPMTNDGWRKERPVKKRHRDAIPIWTFAIGILPFPWLFANSFANKPG